MNIISSVIDALSFKDTIFYKETSDLQDKYDALKKLNEEYPNNEDIQSEMFIVKKGLDGENEIAYQLKKSHIGMYVLRDVKVRYEDLTAQIDYIIITPYYDYFVECKNLVGNITVTEKGDFIREFTINGRKIKKGMYSPLRQVEAQREVMRKIWESKASALKKIVASKYFEHYRRVLVVAANQDTILNTNKAPKEMKYKVLRADALIRQMEYDIKHKLKDDIRSTKNELADRAKSYVDMSSNEDINYYEYYKEKFCLVSNEIQDNEKEEINQVSNEIDDCLKEKLLEFRIKRSNEMRIPPYYVFTDEELDKLLELKPKTIEELQSSNILPSIKVKTHGELIINILNNS